METKIIKAVFGGGTSTVTNKRTRTDYGQVLEIIGIDLPDTFECIFSNSNTSAGVGKKMIGSAQRVLIPDEYLTTGQTIYAWILLHDTEDDGRHMYSIRIPVADMPDTSPEEPTPVEQSVISQAITALNSAVETTTQKAQEASASADRAEHAAEGAEGYAERAESAQQAAESARDMATQAETSARTSAATASEKASEAISSATTASQSAITAENASESAGASATASAESASQASQSADTASGKASDASESAQEASGYASNANASAQTASQKASEAAQSASTATQAKTDAETAKQASETAQGLAETARNDAVSAKTGAESARDEAQEIVDGITGKVEQIDSNTDRIESLEDDRYKPYPTDTVSGSVASFPDGADNIPLKSCIVQIEPVQEGSGDPSPDNVRPISGWTGCEVQRTGKNLFGGIAMGQAIVDAVNVPSNTYLGSDEDGDYVTFAAGGVIDEKVVFTKFKPNIQYTIILKYKKENINSKNLNIGVRYTDGMFETFIANVPAELQTKAFVTQAGKSVLKLETTYGGSRTFLYYNESGIFEGVLTADDFAPYTGQTYPITFPTEAGTVYGGYIDPINGEMVVDRAMVDLGTWNWTMYSVSQGNLFRTPSVANAVLQYDGLNIICSNYPTVKASQRQDKTMSIGSNNRVDIIDSNYSDASAFKTAMNGVQLVYELAEPIHYPITPTEIKTLLGQNNIWADTGDTEVTYRADTTLYISRLTEPDADMIADANITSGSYFMAGNNLYRATANIASGASVIVGTNAVKVSLAQALNEINQ